MDSARQVIRWSMPGWVFLFWLGVFQIIQNIFVYGSVSAALENSALSQLSTGAAAIIIGAGVPLGFLIYQLYYHAYDQWMPLSLAPQDRGGEIIRCLPVEAQEKLRAYEPTLDIDEMCESSTIPLLPLIFGPDLPRLKKRLRNRAGKKSYRKNRQVNFEVVRFYLTVIATELKSESFRQEYTNLSDIYNAIGASRMALICSFVLYVSYNLLSPYHLNALLSIYMYPMLICGLIFLTALTIVQSRRTRTGIASQAILSHTINWYVLDKKDAAEIKNSVTP